MENQLIAFAASGFKALVKIAKGPLRVKQKKWVTITCVTEGGCLYRDCQRAQKSFYEHHLHQTAWRKFGEFSLRRFLGESRAGTLQAKQQQADSKTSPSPNCHQQKFERKFLAELCCIFVETTLSLNSISPLTQGRRYYVYSSWGYRKPKLFIALIEQPAELMVRAYHSAVIHSQQTAVNPASKAYGPEPHLPFTAGCMGAKTSPAFV